MYSIIERDKEDIRDMKFPSLLHLESTYHKQNKITRNRKKENIADFLYEWKSEDNPDEYFDMRENRGYYTLNYQVITHLLCNHHALFNNPNSYKRKEFMKYIENHLFPEETINYMKKHKIYAKDFLCGQLQNMKLLCDSLVNKLPRCKEVIPLTPRTQGLVLYRGFNYNRYKSTIERTANLRIGDIITTDTFLSTSLQELTAIHYIYSNPQKPEHNILWKIIVDTGVYDKFNYAFLSKSFDSSEDDIHALYESNNIGCEFLLNIGAFLKCVAVDTITDFDGTIVKCKYKADYIISKKIYTQYTFRFVGWDWDYMLNITANWTRYMRFLKSKRN
uniref:Uncharacterized protein n=1 Tax=viral metagenome TaxID=1070528 RepID=A0A6C0LFG5_9ZZZZ